MIHIFTAMEGEVVQQLFGFSAVKVVVRMAGFAAIGDDKGVGFDGNTFAIARVRVGDQGANEAPLRFEAALNFCVRIRSKK